MTAKMTTHERSLPEAVAPETNPGSPLTPSETFQPHRRPWRAGLLTWCVAVITLVGLTILLYPTISQWFASYAQSQLIRGYDAEVSTASPDAATQLKLAHEYNALLTAGVDLQANANKAQGTGTLAGTTLQYDDILSANSRGLMARLRFDGANIDIPVYHGTSEAVLLMGAGHLEGSHLPVGGSSTHSVITGHRGLANAAMFSNLDRAEVKDRFTIEVFGEVLTYEVREVRVIEPADTEAIRAVPGKDLVTLITCTPLGINSHRIIVTAERVTPTPIEDVRERGADPSIPGFPWWALILTGSAAILTAFVWRSGFADAQRSSEEPQR